jgi:hypothetical protein
MTSTGIQRRANLVPERIRIPLIWEDHHVARTHLAEGLTDLNRFNGSGISPVIHKFERDLDGAPLAQGNFGLPLFGIEIGRLAMISAALPVSPLILAASAAEFVAFRVLRM